MKLSFPLIHLNPVPAQRHKVQAKSDSAGLNTQTPEPVSVRRVGSQAIYDTVYNALSQMLTIEAFGDRALIDLAQWSRGGAIPSCPRSVATLKGCKVMTAEGDLPEALRVIALKSIVWSGGSEITLVRPIYSAPVIDMPTKVLGLLAKMRLAVANARREIRQFNQQSK